MIEKIKNVFLNYFDIFSSLIPKLISLIDKCIDLSMREIMYSRKSIIIYTRKRVRKNLQIIVLKTIQEIKLLFFLFYFSWGKKGQCSVVERRGPGDFLCPFTPFLYPKGK